MKKFDRYDVNDVNMCEIQLFIETGTSGYLCYICLSCRGKLPPDWTVECDLTSSQVNQVKAARGLKIIQIQSAARCLHLVAKQTEQHSVTLITLDLTSDL